MRSPDPTPIAIFDAEWVAQLSHFEVTHGRDRVTAEVEMLGYGVVERLNEDWMVETIHVATGRKRYDFSACYLSSHVISHEDYNDGDAVAVDLSIEAQDVTVHERVQTQRTVDACQ